VLQQAGIAMGDLLRLTFVALNHTIVMNGQIVGNWKRVFKKEAVVISPYPFTTFTDAEYHAFITVAHHYSKFLDMPVILA
jgi:hypothetical protein